VELDTDYAYRADEKGPDARRRGGATEAYSYTPQGDPDEATKQMGPSRRPAANRKKALRGSEWVRSGRRG